MYRQFLNRAALAAAFLAAGAMTPASAQDQVSAVALAQSLIVNGAPNEGCILLDALYDADSTDAEALYLLAECHLAKDGEAQAAALYARVLELRPDATLVRAKLAGIQVRLGQRQAASATLIEAGVDVPQAESLAELAQLVDNSSTSAVAPSANGFVSLARFYDSNANGGSIASTVEAIFAGAPVLLDIAPTSRAQADWGTTLAAGGSVLHPLSGPYAAIVRGDVSATVYDEQSQFNQLSFAIAAGLVYREAALSWNLLPYARVEWEDGAVDGRTLGIEGRVNYALTPTLSVTGLAGAGWTAVSSDHDRDHWSGLVGGGLHYAFNPQLSGGVQLVARRQGGGAPSDAHTAIGPEIYLEAALTDTLSLTASYGFTHARYDDALAVFPQGRQDDRHTLGLALDIDLGGWQEGLSGFVRYDYANTQSSIDLYDSDRHLISTGLRLNF